MAFQCPPDCGWCCTHLTRQVPREEARATGAFRAALREMGVYHCRDAVTTGLSLSNAEADALRRRAAERRMRLPLHPRTYLLETRRRLAVVLDWHLSREVCPFYADYQCTVYEDRPLVCRAFPVMVASPMSLAPACPKVPAPASAMRVELRARRAIDRAHASLDETAMRALAGGRFAEGLAPAEAARRLRRYRPVAVEAFVGEQPA
ncbi:MAG: putative zinc- or iron-chelating domain [Thermoplasmata archaeon]|jgi:Fe-S-cluster containining protein|nr:putative zinc- or iron-chelating domain [Thermoplasmata archaeon]